MNFFKIRLAAVGLWFLGGLLSNNLAVGLLSMASAVLFGLAMWMEKEEGDAERDQLNAHYHMKGFLDGRRRAQELIGGRLEVLGTRISKETNLGRIVKMEHEKKVLTTASSAIRNYGLYKRGSHK